MNIVRASIVRASIVRANIMRASGQFTKRSGHSRTNPKGGPSQAAVRARWLTAAALTLGLAASCGGADETGPEVAAAEAEAGLDGEAALDGESTVDSDTTAIPSATAVATPTTEPTPGPPTPAPTPTTVPTPTVAAVLLADTTGTEDLEQVLRNIHAATWHLVAHPDQGDMADWATRDWHLELHAWLRDNGYQLRIKGDSPPDSITLQTTVGGNRAQLYISGINPEAQVLHGPEGEVLQTSPYENPVWAQVSTMEQGADGRWRLTAIDPANRLDDDDNSGDSTLRYYTPRTLPALADARIDRSSDSLVIDEVGSTKVTLRTFTDEAEGGACTDLHVENLARYAMCASREGIGDFDRSTVSYITRQMEEFDLHRIYAVSSARVDVDAHRFDGEVDRMRFPLDLDEGVTLDALLSPTTWERIVLQRDGELVNEETVNNRFTCGGWSTVTLEDSRFVELAADGEESFASRDELVAGLLANGEKYTWLPEVESLSDDPPGADVLAKFDTLPDGADWHTFRVSGWGPNGLDKADTWYMLLGAENVGTDQERHFVADTIGRRDCADEPDGDQ